MSFNVMMPWGQAIGPWDQRRPNVKQILQEHSPDVVATQELVIDRSGYHMVNDIVYDSPQFGWYGVGRDADRKDEGSYILFKKDRFTLDESKSGNFWLSTTPNEPSRLGGSYNRICTFVRLVDKASGQGFTVFSMHNYMPAEYDYRLQAARILLQRVAEAQSTGEPVWVAGDFNSSEGDGVAIWLKQGSDNPLPLRDTYREVHPTGTVNTGFGTKFDYIWSPDLPAYSTAESWVVSTPVASDHYPIVANVRWQVAEAITHNIPGLVQSEDFAKAQVVQLESCTDDGGGKNVGYIDVGDFITYKVSVAQAGVYQVTLRHAGLDAIGSLRIIGAKTADVQLSPTGDWQTWKTTVVNVELAAGEQELRLDVLQGGFNLNWLQFEDAPPVGINVEVGRQNRFGKPGSIYLAESGHDLLGRRNK